MDELDMSGVDAMRRSEVRTRVGVVRAFLELASPSESDRRTHADLLGLSVNQFMALVRAWRMHGSPAKMAGAGGHRGGARRPSRISVAKVAKDEAAKIIDKIGPGAPLARISEMVADRCAAMKVAPPSRSTLWNMVMSRRKDVQGRDQGMIIGACAVRLPMLIDDSVVLPTLALAVRADDGAIIAAALSNADWSGFVAEIAGVQPNVRIDQALGSAAGVDGVTPVLSTVARSTISRIVGRGIGKIGLVYQPSKAVAPERLLRTKEDQPLSSSDAREVVAAAVEQHNKGRDVGPLLWIDAINCSSAALGASTGREEEHAAPSRSTVRSN
ncbi:MAG: hypothetical protein ABIV36_17345 [Sphingobium limneticum]